jgi:phenylalanyl-tRNA synthetase beta chain
MKISRQWLLKYITTENELSDDLIAEVLTDCGLEVENTARFTSVKGELAGLIVGEVLSVSRHPNADKLSICIVNTGKETPLNIVCGASNVESGQKVIVALPGTIVHPLHGDTFMIKESKIRGEVSQGMICAEDEIGLGESHAGIMVLNPALKAGSLAADYFDVYRDTVFEIGLTPNRSDAASHIGVARDLAAVFNLSGSARLNNISVKDFKTGTGNATFEVVIDDPLACSRYSALNIFGVDVKESPIWLQNNLKAVGLKPVNNIVDAANFVMFETGHPLHVFDADIIKGKKVIVRKPKAGTLFTTLDGVERELTGNDLMICDENDPMCMAGVYGGIHSGVSSTTQNIFIESACFDPKHIRISSKHHHLKTDASFRFERGVDPDYSVTALKRVAMLIQQLAGGEIAANIQDIYSSPEVPVQIEFSMNRLHSITGIPLKQETVKGILTDLGFDIFSSTVDKIVMVVPSFKRDVTREIDVIEEVIRIYGYNKIQTPGKLSYTIVPSPPDQSEYFKDVSSCYLSDNGFFEIINNSLVAEHHGNTLPAERVQLLNPLSNELNLLRTNLLGSGLSTLAYNFNRRVSDLKFFEFGKTYIQKGVSYIETRGMSLIVTGKKQGIHWKIKQENTDQLFLKAHMQNMFKSAGLNQIKSDYSYGSDLIENGMAFYIDEKIIGFLGMVKAEMLRKFDIVQPVFYGEILVDEVLRLSGKTQMVFQPLAKFPEVKRDLSMLIDEAVRYSEIKKQILDIHDARITHINVFDLYRGDKITEGKKSCAISITIQDTEKTLIEKDIDQIISKVIFALEHNLGAMIRRG